VRSSRRRSILKLCTEQQVQTNATNIISCLYPSISIFTTCQLTLNESDTANQKHSSMKQDPSTSISTGLIRIVTQNGHVQSHAHLDLFSVISGVHHSLRRQIPHVHLRPYPASNSDPASLPSSRLLAVSTVATRVKSYELGCLVVQSSSGKDR
jgi:hypothetical protein